MSRNTHALGFAPRACESSCFVVRTRSAWHVRAALCKKAERAWDATAACLVSLKSRRALALLLSMRRPLRQFARRTLLWNDCSCRTVVIFRTLSAGRAGLVCRSRRRVSAFCARQTLLGLRHRLKALRANTFKHRHCALQQQSARVRRADIAAELRSGVLERVRGARLAVASICLVAKLANRASLTGPMHVSFVAGAAHAVCLVVSPVEGGVPGVGNEPNVSLTVGLRQVT